MKLVNDIKAVQSTDTPTKLVKEFCDFFFFRVYIQKQLLIIV